MKCILKYLCVLSLIVLNLIVVLGNSYFPKSPIIPGNGLIFYDVSTNRTILPPVIEKAMSNHINRINLRQDNMGQPCYCQGMTCTCCAGIGFQQFNFNQKLCTNFIYDPIDFSITMNMMLNDDTIYTNSMSAMNPPPICAPIPIAPIPIRMDMCIKLYKIFMPGNNLHMCMDMEARIQRAPFVILHFQCMRMGEDGFVLLKPEENGGMYSTNAPPEMTTIITDVYDPVTEVKKNFTTTL